MKNLLFTLLVLPALLVLGCQKSDLGPGSDHTLDSRGNCPNKITIPANSVDALQQAIDDICVGGTITLAAGMHTENHGIVIDKRLTIKGQAGAVLKVQSEVLAATPDILDIGIYVVDAQQVRLEGFELLPTEADLGGTAIVIHNADKTTVKDCTIREHYLSIVVEQSDKVEIEGNVVEGSNVYAELFGHGIVVVNGEDAKVKDNEVSNTFFGVWACDKNGVYQGNHTHDNLYLGMILCKVPAPGYGLPGGAFAYAEFSATNWQVNNNVSTHNGFYGYLVIDGANNNHLNNNQGGSNGAYDIDVKGGSCEFGFYTPPSFDNFITTGPHELLIKDCGEHTTIIGGNLVDLTLDPCEDPTPCQ